MAICCDVISGQCKLLLSSLSVLLSGKTLLGQLMVCIEKH